VLTDRGWEEAVPAPFPTNPDISSLVPEIFPTGSDINPPGGEMAAVLPAPSRPTLSLPPVLLGSLTPEIRVRVASFYSSVCEIFERWVNRPRSLHTGRSYKVRKAFFYLSATADCSGLRRRRASSRCRSRRSRNTGMRSPPPVLRPKPSINGSRPSPPFINTWRSRRPSCGCRSSSPIRRTASSSPGSRPILGKKRYRCRRRAPGSSSACRPAIRCWRAGTGPL
jgi:hypothetical protein